MGWFWGSSSDNESSRSMGDAYSKLDPSLREFLDKESPVKYHPGTKTSQNAQQQESYRSQIGITNGESTSAASTSDTTTQVPKESLYQDGRYAHLWKNYQPIADVEASQRSDQDRLTDVIEAYNDRKAQIGRAAVENCVFEQMAEHDCFKKGGLQAKLTMCHAENKAFNRCYQMQSRFLKALGYLGMERTADEEERIQMHADKLYQEMLAREKAIAKAKEEGLPEPDFKPLLNNASVADAMGVKPLPPTQSTASASASVSEALAAAQSKSQPQPLPAVLPKKEGLDIYAADKRKEIEKRLAGKSKMERELEIQLLVAESNASVEYAEKIRDYYDEERVARAQRKERGRQTFGDTMKSLWGWDK